MFGLLAKHSLLAICLAVILEEAGIPLPIPTDLLIIFAGARSVRSIPHLFVLFFALLLSSGIGASILYGVVRRGGRPLVERFGRYVHLGPEQLRRGEDFLQRGGWVTIAVGRMIPGVRYVTVVACGLLKVPYPRFLTAHFVGSSVYIGAFLALGYIFGPGIIERIHVPDLSLRLIWLLVLAVGLPMVLIWAYAHAHPRRPPSPSSRRVFGATLLASFVGATSLSATWSMLPTLGELLGIPGSLTVTHPLAGRLERGLSAASAHLMVVIGFVVLAIALSAVYYGILAVVFASREPRPALQVFELTLLGVGLLVVSTMAISLIGIDESFRDWRRNITPLLVTNLLGILSYASSTVYCRGLVIAVLPSWPVGTRKVVVAQSAADESPADLGGDDSAPTEQGASAPPDVRTATPPGRSASNPR